VGTATFRVCVAHSRMRVCPYGSYAGPHPRASQEAAGRRSPVPANHPPMLGRQQGAIRGNVAPFFLVRVAAAAPTCKDIFRWARALLPT
jgi:hypothetical protein